MQTNMKDYPTLHLDTNQSKGTWETNSTLHLDTNQSKGTWETI
jgi:hypothetical protein